MATTPKNRSKNTKEKPRRPLVNTPVAEQAQTNAELRLALAESLQRENATAIENVRLFKELQDRNRQLTEALEQQTATGEVLRVIASSPTDLQPVLNTLIANAVKLSGATKGHVRQLDDELLRVVANYGETAEEIAFLQSRPGRIGGPFSTARAFSERKPHTDCGCCNRAWPEQCSRPAWSEDVVVSAIAARGNGYRSNRNLA
jgi:hypothetical protein